MSIPSNIRLPPGQVVMVEFGPDPRQIMAPGVMTGPLGVRPEMYKERHCIVVSITSGLTTVVPLSTKPPSVVRAYHFRILAGKYPGMSIIEDSWTKSDLITTVSNQRVDRILVAGRRTTVILDAADLKAVRATVLHALQLGRLTFAL
ncbi:type II toxin-antitoxin system PemK/MazF family toxin [Acidisoma silvae]|uniref:Type II toxin-antitoxin system PemK/MazF family toxin n=1 Tax=Acidisoma silvae TaxID=2802396 RepID=A0A963YS10_9PROT|nr:type II toxin-antitoxin system PemK/MazF family toxin [Acidisoma silvae]MCB8876028.1 type II toxin-antitoxin system PemK/MazF family toxin [Acidisoma silvae]